MSWLPYYFLTFLFSCAIFIISVYLNVNNILDISLSFIVKHNVYNYDFIIVGAGSSGCVIARRLAQNEKYSVLLIEAGGLPGILFDMPFLAPLFQHSVYDWQYKTEPQSNACFGLDNRSSHWPRGKILGGSSRLNYMMYVRGHPQDFDSWEQEGNPGWDYESILPYFKKSEKQEGIFKSDTQYHGLNGPLKVSDTSWSSQLATAFLQAAEWLNYTIGDLNGNLTSGFMMTQFTTTNGKRHSCDDAFLKKKSNLHIITYAQVEKVLFKRGNEAFGVQFKHHGQHRIAIANKEIVLSAGAIGSPHLLMLSGVGPQDHLHNHDIPVVLDLPGVGKNLQDHITTGTDIVLLDDTKCEGVTLGTFPSPKSIWQYFYSGSGPLTSAGCEAIGFVHTSQVDREREPPDLQIMFMPLGFSTDCGKFFQSIVGFSHKAWEKYLAPLCGKAVASLMPVLLRPVSRGEILLKSSNPSDYPLINPNYFSHPKDVSTMIEGMRIVEKIISSPTFVKIGARLNKNPMPGCENLKFGSDEYWSCYVRHLTLTSYHPSGTCRMGPSSNKHSVVDEKLRVHGIKNLRVIDASIMPSIVGANINAATIMIAEKGASMVVRYWKTKAVKCKAVEVLLNLYQCLS